MHASTSLAGCCYTQLTDTACETNDLLDADRSAWPGSALQVAQPATADLGAGSPATEVMAA